MLKVKVTIFLFLSIFIVKSQCNSCVESPTNFSLQCDSLKDLSAHYSVYGYKNVTVDKQESNFFMCDGQIYFFATSDGVQTVQYLTIKNAGVFIISEKCTLGINTLEYIDVSSNIIPKMRLNFFENLENVKSIILSNNQMRELDTTNVSLIYKFKHFDVSGNRLRSFKLKITKNQWLNLNLAKNEISSFEIATPYIETLNLSYNNIATFSSYHLKVNQLLYLDLRYNYLTIMTEDMAKCLKDARSINLAHNRIQKIFLQEGVYHWSQNYIDISFNKLTSLENIKSSYGQKFRTITLNNNKINELAAKNISFRTEHFSCESCSISFVDPYLFSNFFDKTTHLYLRDNSISSANIFKTKSDKSLNLEKIDLSYNAIKRIRSMYFVILKNVIELFLDNNQIVEVQPGSFSHMKNLRLLSLANNNIFRFTTFFIPSTLVGLDLSSNILMAFGLPNDEIFPKLQYLKLDNNPLSCGCINKMKSWQEKRNVYVSLPDSGTSCTGEDRKCLSDTSSEEEA